MNGEKWHTTEYENLRVELNDRIKFLHNTINLAIIFWLIFLITTFIFLAIGLKREYLYTFLLIAPLVIDLLGYNYQSNQNSLESIARYFHEHIKPTLEKNNNVAVLGWEKYFAKQKEPFRLESVTKIFPFIFPSAIPFYLLITKSHLVDYQIVLVIIDIIFFILLVENFRYKLRRVK